MEILLKLQDPWVLKYRCCQEDSYSTLYDKYGNAFKMTIAFDRKNYLIRMVDS